MAGKVIHISENEAVHELADLLTRVRAGAEVIIESGAVPIAVLHGPGSTTTIYRRMHSSPAGGLAGHHR